jgi:hypothetical protein
LPHCTPRRKHISSTDLTPPCHAVAVIEPAVSHGGMHGTA